MTFFQELKASLTEALQIKKNRKPKGIVEDRSVKTDPPTPEKRTQKDR